MRAVFVCVAVAMMGAIGVSQAAEIAPTPVVIKSYDQSVIAYITEDGTPVPRSALGVVRLLIAGHNYARMLQIERIAGGLELTPSKSLEVGTYDLEVSVRGVRTVGQILVTLEDEPDSLNSRAAAEGLTEADIRHQLGLYTVGRQSVSISLPESYYVGKQVRFVAPTPTGTSYEWRVNDELSDTGVGPHTFIHTLVSAGMYRFRYTEYHADGTQVETEAVTEAREELPVTVTVERGGSVHLIGPARYSGYTWLIDGVYISEASDFVHPFPDRGTYRVACIATGNETMRDEAFRKILFVVTVR